MKNNFLSHDNFSYIINYVFRDVKSNTDIDISSDKKYISILKKLIQTIYKKNLNKNVSTEFLNNLVIDKGIPFIIKQLNKDNKKNMTGLDNNQPVTYSQRPVSSDIKNSHSYNYSDLKLEGEDSKDNDSNMSGISTRDDKVDFTRKMQEFQDDRKYEGVNSNEFESNRIKKDISDIIGKNSQNEDKTDIMAKLKELQTDRGYQSPQMESNPDYSTNQNIDEGKLEINTSLINKLYENNLDQNHKDKQEINLDNNSQNNSVDISNELKGETNKSYFSYDNSLDNYDISINPLKTMKNLEMNIQDTTNELENSNNNSIENLKDIQKDTLSKSKVEEYLNSTLMSTNYINKRQKKHVMTIDISADLPDIEAGRKAVINMSNNYWHKFKVNLIEPLIMDSVYDVYLESITINNPARADNNNLYYVIDIQEFNIKTNSNNIFMMDKFIIPNENTTGSGDNKIMKYHLKSNYVATVNPTKLNSLTYTITNENNESVNNFLVSTTNSTTVNTVVNINTTTAFNVTSTAGLNVNDLIYNRNGVLIGIITALVVGTSITVGGRTLVALVAGEEIFTGSTMVNTAVNANTTTAFNVTSTAGLNVNDLIYNRNGVLIGIITVLTATSITVVGGTLVALVAGEEIFTGNPVNNVALNNTNFYTTVAVINNTNTFDLTKPTGTTNLVSGEKLFTLDGSYVGQIKEDEFDQEGNIISLGVTRLSTTRLTIILKENVNLPLGNGQVLFNINPTNMIQVFSSNSTSNKVIMEFIMVSR